MMGRAAVLPLVTASLMGLAGAERANAQDAQCETASLDRLFLAQSQHQPTATVLSFNSVASVENYYGVASEPAKLAAEFFKGYSGSSACMLFTRLPVLSARAHLYGGNVGGLTLDQLRAINGTLSVTSQGYPYSADINLSHAKSFKDAARILQAQLNHTLPPAAATTGSSIKPVSVSFTGSVNNLLLNVTSVSSGTIEVGSIISGAGIPANAQITSQVSGTSGGVGVYGLYVPEGHIASENLTDSYGVLTVGSTTSGTVAIGQHVVGKGVLADTAIETHLSGSGAASTWVVNYAQTEASEKITMTGALLSVTWSNVQGAGNQKSGFFSIQQNGDFLYNSSSVSYASGSSAAAALGLTQDTGAFLTPEEIVPITEAALAAFMNDLIAANPDDPFSTFQTTWDPKDFTPPGEAADLEAWAASTDGEYSYLEGYSATTPPIENSEDAFAAPATAAVPEPSTWAMALLGFAGLSLARYRLGASSSRRLRGIGSTRRTSEDAEVVR
jgi:Protein of unknown function (DUF3383)/PEP-CTERM motif